MVSQSRLGQPTASLVPISHLLGQRLVVGFHGTRPSPELLRRARQGRMGGVILMGENIRGPAQIASLTRRLQRAAAAGGNPPLLVTVDQEGGLVRRFAAGPPTASPPQMAARTPGFAYRQGRDTARYLARVGVNADFAPVADVPTSPASFIAREGRAFSADPTTVAMYAGAFVRGLHAGGVLATAKHFPGLGSARTNTDFQRQTLDLTPRELRRALIPFTRLIHDRVDMVMLSLAAFPAYDPSGAPAALSGKVEHFLRDGLKFDGVTVTDALEGPTAGSHVDAGVRAAEAGADLLLYTGSANAELDALRAAAVGGRLSRPALEASYDRILTLKRRLR
jgi:beta-N-acetylhexosaminidase